MINTKPHLEPIEAIDYLRFIPSELHQEAKDFVDYTTYAPFEKPECCIYCQSSSLTSIKAGMLQRYQCQHCKKECNPLSGTALAGGYKQPELWGDMAKCMLTGLSVAQVKKQISKLNYGAILGRERPLERLMLEHFPKLHAWWLLFRYQTNVSSVYLPPQVEVEVKQFRIWLKDFLHPKAVFCPRCKKQAIYRGKQVNQSDYTCKVCCLIFSHLSNTRFVEMTNIQELPLFFEYLLSGAHNYEMAQKSGVSGQPIAARMSVVYWRRKFRAQLKDLNLHLLADWIEWKRYCRSRQLRKELQEQNKKE